MFTFVRLLALAATVSAFSPTRTQLELDVSPDGVVGWVKGARASPDASIEIRVALQHPRERIEELRTIFEAVSDPLSPKYGKHLTNEQVHALLAPSADTVAAVRAHLAAHMPGATIQAPTLNSDQLVIVTSIAAAEAAFGCEYFEYSHAASGSRALRTPAYSLPSSLAPMVDFVAPTVRLPALWRGAEVLPKLTTPDGLFNTPKSLRKLYSVGDAVGVAANNRQAVTGFLGQHFKQSDLSEFNTLFFGQAKHYVSAKMATKGDDPTGLLSGVEAMLDAEYITALGANISSEFWGFSGKAPDNPENEPFLKWLGVVSNTTDETVPKLFSTSYGEDESSVSVAYAERINVEFMKAGARGISLLFASGDSGANCKNSKFEPNWPAASPYVTAVGGTSGQSPEQAVGLSSGGFSNRYGVPSWQKAAVATYLANPKVPDRKLFNASGRGFPDISAQAVGFVVVSNLIPNPGVAGTSCASPTAAGVIGLLNDLRLARGKPSLGFLNPFLYGTAAAALNDITSGANEGCGFEDAGFSAVAGWDPVTGLGSPNYAALAKAVLSLP